MNPKQPHPVPLDVFYAEYIRQLSADDRPSAYTAYCRTEAHFYSDEYPRRYINHATFRSSISRHLKRKKAA